MAWDIRILRWLIWIVCTGFILINLWDLYILFTAQADYTFGAEAHPRYSIYASREIYISYVLVFILSLFAMIYFSYKRQWHAFFVSFL